MLPPPRSPSPRRASCASPLSQPTPAPPDAPAASALLSHTPPTAPIPSIELPTGFCRNYECSSFFCFLSSPFASVLGLRIGRLHPSQPCIYKRRDHFVVVKV